MPMDTLFLFLESRAVTSVQLHFHTKFKEKKAHLVPNIRVRDPGHTTWRRASLCPNDIFYMFYCNNNIDCCLLQLSREHKLQ